MKRIPLINSDEFALVDEEDFARVSKFRWRLGKGEVTKSAPPQIPLSHFLLGKPPKKREWDHENRNPLDNRWLNLRLATRSQNCANRKIPNKSGYRGVVYFRWRNNWLANICFHRRKIFIGRYETAEEAARKYDERAYLLFGRFAVLNFPISRFPRKP